MSRISSSEVYLEGLLSFVPASFALAWALTATAARRAGRFLGGVRDGLLWGFLFWLTLVPSGSTLKCNTD